ncbi:MAG: hypothetical protein ACE5HS_15875 [bacterium]
MQSVEIMNLKWGDRRVFSFIWKISFSILFLVLPLSTFSISQDKKHLKVNNLFIQIDTVRVDNNQISL